METASFEDFKKLDIRIGKILEAEKMEGSDKLLKLKVDFGSSSKVLPDGNIVEDRETRQILAGIAAYYAPEVLVGKECPFVFNLAPKTMMGHESQGMILAADDGGPVLMHPDKDIAPGSTVK